MKKSIRNAAFCLLTVLTIFACTQKSRHYGGINPDKSSYPRGEMHLYEGAKMDVQKGINFGEPVINNGIGDSTNFNTEEYAGIVENPFMSSSENPLSTFSIDVDNASYSNVRRYIRDMKQMPPEGAVRIEEMINYFDYEYKDPIGQHPFSITTEIGAAPWNKEHQLVHIGIQGKKPDFKNLKRNNLVFLIDCSGSMSDDNKLPLLKKSLNLLLNQMSENDKVSIVAYAGAAGLILPPTIASEKNKILDALDRLNAGGSTAGGEGIELAYKTAKNAFIADGNNRVILCTDGDFNVGVSSTDQLIKLIEAKRKENIFITACGFGMGNYKDNRMEEIAKNGNGNYFYIDDIREAKKVFEREMHANMFAIAKDVKIQIEFNPNLVKAYRLIGYENRIMKKEDFDDDTKDAGELGSGHNVTAIYEIIPVGSASAQEIKKSTSLKYQQTTVANNASDLMTVKFRYKPLKSDESILIEEVLKKTDLTQIDKTSENFRFSAAVAGFGMILRNSEFKAGLNYDMVENLATGSLGADKHGDRADFIALLRMAKQLQ